MHAAFVFFAIVTFVAARPHDATGQYGPALTDPEGTAQGHYDDSLGRVSGSYTFKLHDGRERTVVYTADEEGYRAEVITNQLESEGKNPAESVEPRPRHD